MGNDYSCPKCSGDLRQKGNLFTCKEKDCGLQFTIRDKKGTKEEEVASLKCPACGGEIVIYSAIFDSSSIRNGYLVFKCPTCEVRLHAPISIDVSMTKVDKIN